MILTIFYVYFGTDVDSARSAFNSLGLETVPRLYIVPPTDAGDPQQSFGDFEISIEKAVEGKLLDEIKRATKVEIRILWEPLPVTIGLCVFSVILAYVADAAFRAGKDAWYWYRSPRLWMLISFAAFSVGVSGTIYCIIRSAPLYGTARDGGLEIFSGESREQFLLEGIIIAGYVLGAATGLILMHYSTTLSNVIVRHICVCISIGIFLTMGQNIFESYTHKTSWYNIKDTLPAPVWEFMSSSVKKNSGILKRIYRILEIFLSDDFDLFDGDDWRKLQLKFRTLIIDYIIRVMGFSTGGTTASTSTGKGDF